MGKSRVLTNFHSTIPQLEGDAHELAQHFLAEETQGFIPSPLVDQIESPACRAGGMMIYDYRTIHRGLPNPLEGRERPVAYVIIATGGADEGYNFPETSVSDDLSPAFIEAFPFFQQLSATIRERNAGEVLKFLCFLEDEWKKTLIRADEAL